MKAMILDKIEKEQCQVSKEIAPFRIGDTVKVHVKIKEGEKERIQAFTGVVISRRGRGQSDSITVRRISYGEGVERLFPLQSPSVAKIEVERPGKVCRSKLYYLRRKSGKNARIEERRD